MSTEPAKALDENKLADVLWNMYKENCEQGRHHETQRSTVMNLVLVLVGGALAFISSDHLVNRADLPLTTFIIFLGGIGAVFTYKHYERFNLHMARARKYRDALDELLPGIDKAAPETWKKFEEGRKKPGETSESDSTVPARSTKRFAEWARKLGKALKNIPGDKDQEKRSTQGDIQPQQQKSRSRKERLLEVKQEELISSGPLDRKPLKVLKVWGDESHIKHFGLLAEGSPVSRLYSFWFSLNLLVILLGIGLTLWAWLHPQPPCPPPSPPPASSSPQPLSHPGSIQRERRSRHIA